MSDKTENGWRSARVWSYIVGSLHAVISSLFIILLTATLAIYHRDDIQADKSEGSLGMTPLTGYIVGLLGALWSFACSVLLLRGLKLKRTKFMLPFLFWYALIIVVSIIAAIVEFIMDLVNRQTIVAALSNFAIEFVLSAILFVMLVPIVLHYNSLKMRAPYSAQL